MMLSLFCLLAGQAVSYSQDFSFHDGVCDFGTIEEKDGPVTRSFEFRNNRRDTVVICDITTVCRCMTGQPSFHKVAPGETGSISLRFDPAYRSGDFNYSVVLWYFDRKLHQSIKVKGNVVPMKHPVEEDHPYSWGEGLYTSHKVLPFGSIKPGETKEIFFRYGNGTDKPMDLRLETEGCCAHTIDMERHLTLAPDQRGKLYVRITMPEGYSGRHVNRIWFIVNGVRIETPMLVKMTTL